MRELRFKMATNCFGKEDVEYLADLLHRKTGFRFRSAGDKDDFVVVMPPADVLPSRQHLARLNPVTSLGCKFAGVGG